MFYVSARKSAPNDGTGKGEVQGYPNAYSHSKQNSDAGGFFYQWGRKDPFTFATSSLNGGKYSVKIYSGKRELIYQVDDGGDNTGKTPEGGMIFQDLASSMMKTVNKPNLFYWSNSAVINQVEHSKELWNYYWTSYSRGTDGNSTKTTWHNTYLDGYIVLRSKSIYDPCPYGYRTPTNGTYNDFNSNQGWNLNSYDGGVFWNKAENGTWLALNGSRITILVWYGNYGAYYTSSISNKTTAYSVMAYYNKEIVKNSPTHGKSWSRSIRCIEDATVKADQSEASASLKFYNHLASVAVKR